MKIFNLRLAVFNVSFAIFSIFVIAVIFSSLQQKETLTFIKGDSSQYWEVNADQYKATFKPNGLLLADANADNWLMKWGVDTGPRVTSKNSLTYGEVAKGVSARMYDDGNQRLAYDFIVEPGASVSDIQVDLIGEEVPSLNSDGELVLPTQGGALVHSAPHTYQFIDEEEVSIDSRFILAGNTLSFLVGEYNPNYELIIDPKIIFVGNKVAGDSKKIKPGMTGPLNATHGVLPQGSGTVFGRGASKLSNWEVVSVEAIHLEKNVAAPLITLGGQTNVNCNNNGSMFDPTDDYLVFELNPSPGVGEYSISSSQYTITPSTGTFGSSTTFTLSSGSAGNGDIPIVIRDLTANLTLADTIVDPGFCLPSICSSPDYNVDSVKQTISLSSMIGLFGNIDDLKDGDNTAAGGSISYGSAAISNQEYLKMELAVPELFKGFELAVQGPVFTAGAEIKIQGSHDDANWVDLLTKTETGNTSPCIYGNCTDAITFEFPANDTTYLYYRVYGVSGSTLGDGVHEILFDKITNIGLVNVICNDGGTADNVNDDFISFEISPVPGIGFYDVIIDGYSVTPTSGEFGSTTIFTLPPGSAGNGDVSITIFDALKSCIIKGVVPDPGYCVAAPCASTDFNEVSNKSAIIISEECINFLGGVSSSWIDGNIATDAVICGHGNMSNENYVQLEFPSAIVLKGFEQRSQPLKAAADMWHNWLDRALAFVERLYRREATWFCVTSACLIVTNPLLSRCLIE